MGRDPPEAGHGTVSLYPYSQVPTIGEGPWEAPDWMRK